jgi:hypothetical protein
MNKLSEAFVTELLKTRARGRIRVVAQSELALGEDGKVNMRPDLVTRIAYKIRFGVLVGAFF